MSVRDIVNIGKVFDVPGIRKTTVRCCYHCVHSGTNLKKWYCSKYPAVEFGGNTGDLISSDAVSNMCEIVCNDFTETA